MYIKGDFTPSQIRWSDTYHPQYSPFANNMKEILPIQSSMIRYAQYLDQKRVAFPFNPQWNFNKRTNIYKHCDTPFVTLSSTSRYYNPLETDSYLPRYVYDNGSLKSSDGD